MHGSDLCMTMPRCRHNDDVRGIDPFCIRYGVLEVCLGAGGFSRRPGTTPGFAAVRYSTQPSWLKHACIRVDGTRGYTADAVPAQLTALMTPPS